MWLYFPPLRQFIIFQLDFVLILSSCLNTSHKPLKYAKLCFHSIIHVVWSTTLAVIVLLQSALEIFSIIDLVSLFSSLGGNTICSSANFGLNVWCLLPTLATHFFPSYTSTVYCIIMKEFCTKSSWLLTFDNIFVLNASATGKPIGG